jgi:hypothetical protein
MQINKRAKIRMKMSFMRRMKKEKTIKVRMNPE